jgi:histidinol-phosphate/aromatic aminotransferase/cobyric acid decarboxylase-like protein
MRPLSPQFKPYGWALSTAAIAARAGIAPHDVLRFDGNTAPDPPPTARPETIADALGRIQSYRHGGFPELLRAIADYNGLEPENVVLGSGADDLLMLCARA